MQDVDAGEHLTGEHLTVAQTWALAQLWYHNRLALEYRGRTVAQVEAIFRSLDLTSPFWYMDERA